MDTNAAANRFLLLAWSLGRAILTALVGHTAVNAAVTYDAILVWPSSSAGSPQRWLGRCKKCRKGRRIDGAIALGRRGGRDEIIIVSGAQCYRTANSGENPSELFVTCCDARVKLSRVYDHVKPGKPRHECNAKCLAATGPACECKCKGANHGGGH